MFCDFRKFVGFFVNSLYKMSKSRDRFCVKKINLFDFPKVIKLILFKMIGRILILGLSDVNILGYISQKEANHKEVTKVNNYSVNNSKA